MLPVIELEGRVAQVRDMDPGETIAATGWTAERPSRIALVAVGRADGFPDAAASTSDKPLQAIFGQKICPIVGRVAADRLAVDMTELSAPAMAGELITLVGRQIGIDEIAAAAGSSGYQMLTRLGRRFHRIYRASTRIRYLPSVNEEIHMLDKLNGQDERKGSAPFAANVAGTVQHLHSSTPAQQAAVSASSGTATSINADTTITGKVRSSGAVTVSGRIEGELSAESAVICEGAEVDGTIITRELTVGGRVKGAIRAMRVHLLGTAVVEADIFHRILSIDENAMFEGTSKRQENPSEVSQLGVESPPLQSHPATRIDAAEASQARVQPDG
jgi:cytoskeletal protein CcmA (bactofilin family)